MKSIFVIISLALTEVVSAQGLNVSGIKEVVSGSDAFHAPKDNNGSFCGLVKISSVISDLSFEGNIVGDVALNNNEYKVFLESGSNSITIKRPHALPVLVNFSEYGIDGIASKATYSISVKDVSLNKKKNVLHIDAKPTTAKVFVDNTLIENEAGDGGYVLYLPKGEHLCKIENAGYRTHVETFKIGKEPVNINVNLESLLATLEIDCVNSTADVSINGEWVAKGSWKGQLPPGTYQIKAEQEGFVSSEKKIVLIEKGNLRLTIPQLKRAKGSVYVTALINKVEAFLDGMKIATNRCVANVQAGNHTLVVKAPFGYKATERKIMVKADQVDTIRVEMEPLNELYKKAFNDDVNAQAIICLEKNRYVIKDTTEILERNYWYERIFANIENLKDSLLQELTNYLNFRYSDEHGIYDYFKGDHLKGLKILLKYPDGEGCRETIAQHYCELGDYENSIVWGTKAIQDPDLGPYYDCPKIVLDACFKMKDIDKGVSIMLGVMDKGWNDDEKFCLYECVGDIYKKKGDFTKAVLYYRKCLNLSPMVIGEWKVNDVYKKIRECN